MVSSLLMIVIIISMNYDSQVANKSQNAVCLNNLREHEGRLSVSKMEDVK